MRSSDRLRFCLIPHLLKQSFEVYFTLHGDKSERTYNYGFCINKEGVTEEWLNSKAKTARKYSTVFYRGTTDEELDLSGFPKSSRDNIQVALEKQVLIISLGAKLTEASATPTNLRTVFSTLLAHPAQCMFSTGNVCFFKLPIYCFYFKFYIKTISTGRLFDYFLSSCFVSFTNSAS